MFVLINVMDRGADQRGGSCVQADGVYVLNVFIFFENVTPGDLFSIRAVKEGQGDTMAV